MFTSPRLHVAADMTLLIMFIGCIEINFLHPFNDYLHSRATAAAGPTASQPHTATFTIDRQKFSIGKINYACCIWMFTIHNSHMICEHTNVNNIKRSGTITAGERYIYMHIIVRKQRKNIVLVYCVWAGPIVQQTAEEMHIWIRRSDRPMASARWMNDHNVHIAIHSGLVYMRFRAVSAHALHCTGILRHRVDRARAGAPPHTDETESGWTATRWKQSASE